ncbi:MAG TPA: hypothetical protein VIJ55_03780 [Acetobacteraceae bacterium]
MRLGISRRAYARSRGVWHGTINHAVRTGLIRPLPDGTIDPDQADASWFRMHAARLAPMRLDPEEAARMDAEIAALMRSLGELVPTSDEEADRLMRSLGDLGWLTDPVAR